MYVRMVQLLHMSYTRLGLPLVVLEKEDNSNKNTNDENRKKTEPYTPIPRGAVHDGPSQGDKDMESGLGGCFDILGGVCTVGHIKNSS